MTLRRLSATALAALAVTGIAACGSDDDGTSTKTSGSSGSASAGAPAGDAIQLGFICSCSGAQKGLLGKTKDVILAWEKKVNDSGGIGGTPVKVITKDDGGDPAKALQAAKELVEGEHVIAIVGESSIADAAFGDYVKKKGIPVVGGVSPEPVFGENPSFYASGSTLLPLITGTLAQAKGRETLGTLYCAETPVCAQLVPLAKGIGSLFNLEIASGKVSGTQPNYTASCAQMKSAGADALFVAAAGSVVKSVVEDCAQQGYKPLPVVQGSTLTNPLRKAETLQGASVASTHANPFDASVPGVKEFQEAIEAYEPGMLEADAFSFDGIYPWSGGKLFEAAAKAAKLTAAATPADVKRGLYALKGETLGGISPPLTYTAGKPFFTPCWFSGKIDGGTLVSQNAGKPTCLDQQQTGALMKAIGA